MRTSQQSLERSVAIVSDQITYKFPGIIDTKISGRILLQARSGGALILHLWCQHGEPRLHVFGVAFIGLVDTRIMMCRASINPVRAGIGSSVVLGQV